MVTVLLTANKKAARVFFGFGLIYLLPAIFLINCENDENGETRPEVGYIWFCSNYVSRDEWVQKIRLDTGTPVRKGLTDFTESFSVAGIPVDEETGDVFLHERTHFLAKYDKDGRLVWMNGGEPYSWHQYFSLVYFKEGGFLWALEDNKNLAKYNSSDGGFLFILPLLISGDLLPLQLEVSTGNVWVATSTDLMNVSPGGSILYREEFGSGIRCKGVYIDKVTSDLWLVFAETGGTRDKLVKCSPTGEKIFEKCIGPFYGGPIGGAVNGTTGGVWLAYAMGIEVCNGNGEVQRILNYEDVRAIIFTDNVAVLGGGELGDGFIIALDTFSYKRLWEYRPRETGEPYGLAYAKR